MMTASQNYCGTTGLFTSRARLLAGISLPVMAALCDGGNTIIPPAAAQPAVALEEIVVTARRTEENLMTVPLAVTAITSALMEERRITNMMEVATFTPGFHFTDETASSASGRANRASFDLQFRGNSIASGTLFIDGTPVAGNRPPPFADIERIEVLKGPQSVYFGRSTYTGAINYVTKEPGDTYQGVVSTEYSSFNSNEELISFEGPVVEGRLSARISLSHWYKGGHYKNETNKSERLGQRSTNSAALSLVFTPNDNLKFKNWFNAYKDEDGPAANASLKGPVGSFLPSQLNCNLGGSRGAYYCGVLPDWDELRPYTISHYGVVDQLYDQEIFGNRLGFVTAYDPSGFLDHAGLMRVAFQDQFRADYTTEGDYNVSFLTAYHKNKQQFLHDQSGVDVRFYPNPNFGRVAFAPPYPTWFFNGQSKGYDLSTEARVTSPGEDRLRWTVGANYVHSETRSSTFTLKPQGAGGSSSPSLTHPTTKAIFGGVYYDFTEDVTLSAEARYQWDHVKNDQLGNAAGFALPTGVNKLSGKFKAFSPRVILDYRYTDNSTVYILFSRGYLPGGFNTSLFTQPQFILDQLAAAGAQRQFDQERLDNYEAGLKSTFLDGRARTTIAVYYDLLRKGQIGNTITFTNQLGQATLLTVTQNLGSVNLYGLEFEGEFQVTEPLKLGATFNYADTDVKRFFCSDCVSIRGNALNHGDTLQQNAKYKYTIYGDYTAPFTGDYKWYVRGDYTYRAKYFLENANVAIVPALHMAGARIGVRSDVLTIEAFVTNALFDKGLRGSIGLDTVPMNAAGVSTFPNEIRLSLPDKRTFGIKTRYNF